MIQDRMFGVVLWADAQDSKAVVWCEDHGNLAYFNASDANVHDGFALDAGDLIQFEMREDRDCRRVSNPRRVDMGFAPSLPLTLRDEATSPKSEAGSAAEPQEGVVVAFPGARH